jgi:hypothetical protein
MCKWENKKIYFIVFLKQTIFITIFINDLIGNDLYVPTKKSRFNYQQT